MSTTYVYMGWPGNLFLMVKKLTRNFRKNGNIGFLWEFRKLETDKSAMFLLEISLPNHNPLLWSDYSTFIV